MHRQRPLQNSMFLPDNSTRKQANDLQSHNNPMKRSANFSNNAQTPQNPYFLSSNHASNLNSTPRPHYPLETRQNYNKKSIETTLSQMTQRMEHLGRIVDKHEHLLNAQNDAATKADQITKTVLNQIRQSLPSLNNSNDVYEHIFNIKMEIKDMKEEISKNVKENDFKKLETSLKGMMGENGKKNSNERLDTQILQKRDQFFQNLVGNLETQISFLKKHLNNYNLQFKVSPIRSSNSILLKYQQLFKARVKGQTDMIISEHMYYIDQQGHLLDNQSRYIVDQKGKKVKLQEKHITMLRNQKILY